MLKTVSSHLNLGEMESRVRERWESEGLFAKLISKNEQGPTFSFFDGPMTANNPMGVHHAWGRTYKDLYQRHRAMEGYTQRYQNGFDCQGLWVEVEVEKELGLNSKRDILDYGLDKFNEKCRQRVLKYAGVQTEQSKRLGQWMDWDNSYYTMDNRNIQHIWYFLKACHEKGMLYKGHRVMPWCCRCGTSLSQHELTDSYKDMTHTSVYVRFPLLDNLRGVSDAGYAGASLLVWTTTPWTLPANTGVAVHPDLDYVLLPAEDGGLPVWVAESSPLAQDQLLQVGPLNRCKGRDMAGWSYLAPFGSELGFTAVGDVDDTRRVVVWEAVESGEGSGLVHIAPGCGAEDHELGQKEGLATLLPIDGFGVYLGGYGPLTGKDVKVGGKIVLKLLRSQGLLLKEEQHLHRYPVCWRCGEELVFRLEDEWFIKTEGLRQPMRDASAEVKWMPDHAGKRMDDWLSNMGDWCISRKRFWGMPLPFYQCSCGHLQVIGSLDELRNKALSPELITGKFDLHRPDIDTVTITCPSCNMPVYRVDEVGDCWLDAGIVPFSTLDYLNDHGPDSQWSKWFPADFVCEMREQIRLWFYSMLFMSVVLTGKAPYKSVLVYEKVHDEKGRPMHKSSGNAIWFDDAVDRMGADVMRWLYSARNPSQNLNFGYNEAAKVRSKLMTLWNVYSFLTTYAALDGWSPKSVSDDSSKPIPSSSLLLDRWLGARTRQMAARCRDALWSYDAVSMVSELDAYIDDLSNWYVRRNRRRFWKSLGDADKDAGYTVLHWALMTFCQVAAPLLPFVCDEMWRNLTSGLELPASVHLTTYPVFLSHENDTVVLLEMEMVRKVANLGLAARNAENIRVRQPLQSMKVALTDGLAWPEGADDILCDELNVKAVLHCNLATSEKDEGDDDIFVTLDTSIDDSLLWEGVTRDLIRHVQSARKASGLAVDETMRLVVSGDDVARVGLLPFKALLASETLAREVALVDLTYCHGDFSRLQQVKCGDVVLSIGVAR